MRGTQVREDLKQVASRFRAGEVWDYVPPYDREDYEARIEKYYKMPFKKWLEQRRAGASMKGGDE